jgi:hypothetical protein
LDDFPNNSRAEFLHERLPASRLEIVDAGLFVWEEASADYTSIILDSSLLSAREGAAS